MEVEVAKADRLLWIPPYLFDKMDQLRRKMEAEGKDVINLSIGDPDQPTPQPIIEALSEAAQESWRHRYPPYEGLKEFRQAVVNWYQKRFGVSLHPETEVLALIGSKEGIAHLPLALLNPGDVALVPDPAYTVYQAATIFAGGMPYYLPLLSSRHFLPDLKAVDRQVARKAKLLFINYPNNPTGAVASEEFFEEVIKFAQDNSLIVCHDAAYTEIAYDGYRPPSLLQFGGGKTVGIEINSLSKPYNMTGWRIGYAVGNARIISYLRELKTNVDSGVFGAIQHAGAVALDKCQNHIQHIVNIYQKRRDILVEGLDKLNWKVEKPRATFYVWAAVPPDYTSLQLATLLLEKAAIVVTPGTGFGKNGEGYIRFSLTTDQERLREAVDRIKKVPM